MSDFAFLIYIIFFVLFPRDQCFYILCVLKAQEYIVTFVKIVLAKPQLYYTAYNKENPNQGI